MPTTSTAELLHALKLVHVRTDAAGRCALRGTAACCCVQIFLKRLCCALIVVFNKPARCCRSCPRARALDDSGAQRERRRRVSVGMLVTFQEVVRTHFFALCAWQASSRSGVRPRSPPPASTVGGSSAGRPATCLGPRRRSLRPLQTR